MLAPRRVIIAIIGCGWAAALAACYDPQIVDGALGCPNGTCPRGFRCGADRRCWRVPVEDSGQSGGAPVATGGAGGSGAAGSGGVTASGGKGGTPGTPSSGGAAGGLAGVSGVAGTNTGGKPALGGAVGSAGHGGGGGVPGTGGGFQNGTGGSAPSGGAPGVGGRAGTGGTGGAVADAGVDVAQGTGGSSPLGAACTSDLACASKFCVDGVCCNALCDGQCQACNLAKPGTCSPVTTGGPIGSKRQPCPGSGVCGAACALVAPSTTTAACTFPKSDHACASPSCAGNTLTPTAFCDGAGTCVPPAGMACPFGLKCLGATACLTGCSSAADCVATSPFCDPVNQRCTAARPVGSSCASNGECQNGQCVDRFCCDAACGESCRACDLTGQEGRCTSLPAGNQPRGTLRTPCGGSGACGARCDCASPQCTFPGPETTCSCPVLGRGSCDLKGGCQTLLGLCL